MDAALSGDSLLCIWMKSHRHSRCHQTSPQSIAWSHWMRRISSLQWPQHPPLLSWSLASCASAYSIWISMCYHLQAWSAILGIVNLQCRVRIRGSNEHWDRVLLAQTPHRQLLQIILHLEMPPLWSCNLYLLLKAGRRLCWSQGFHSFVHSWSWTICTWWELGNQWLTLPSHRGCWSSTRTLLRWRTETRSCTHPRSLHSFVVRGVTSHEEQGMCLKCH